MNEEQYNKLNVEFLKEGYFPRGRDTLLDVLINLAIIIPSIFLFLGWSFIWVLPFIFVSLSGKPKWFCRYTSFHWNRMYKMQNKLLDYNNERLKEIKSLIRRSEDR